MARSFTGILPSTTLVRPARRRRYVAPARGAVDPRCFDAPIFDGFRAHADWLTGPEWPSLATMNAALAGARHSFSDVPLRFAEQTPALLADGLHYEQRIDQRGEIATRADNWHDLFNALVWIEHPQIKAALNARQSADVSVIGNVARTRAQCALTHFDEGGAIVLLRDPVLLALWDTHDWHGLFWRERAAWSEGRAKVLVFGHALLEHALTTDGVHTAKCVAVLQDSCPVRGERAQRRRNCEAVELVEPHSGRLERDVARQRVATAIIEGSLMNDPQELRPLPLSGIPGWHPDTVRESFYREAPCFRPLRSGRLYPAPLRC